MSSDNRFTKLTIGSSYSDGNVVDVVRHGDDQGVTTADTIDHTARTNKLRDLIFGFDGDDTIKSGKGEDYVYGGAGIDKIWGGDDKDVLVGEAGNDELRGEKGDDILWGGVKGTDGSADGETDKADYSAAPAAITITFDGSTATPTLTVKDGEGGTDALHSIEEILGTSGKDRLAYKGDISAGYKLKIDAAGGVDDILNLDGASSGLTLNLNAAGTGTLTSKATGGKIDLVNFHTSVIGTNYDDTITDESTGDKKIDGGAGDDVITVNGNGAANIRGGDGDDELNGGDANDVLVGGSGANVLEGNGGSDRLVVSSDGDVADGGEGSDMLVVTADALSGADIVLRGGAGDDVIDARAHAETDPLMPSRHYQEGDPAVILEFRAGDGHDTLLGDGWRDLTPDWSLPDGLATIGFSRTWGVDKIFFPDLLVSDVTLVWDWVWIEESPFRAGPGKNTWYLAGNLAIVVNGTGDSIYLGNVAATAWTTDPYHLFDNAPETLVGHISGITLPRLMFADGPMVFNADGLTNSHIAIGSVDAYKGAEEAYRAATETGPGATEGTDGDDDLAGGASDDDIDAGDGDDGIAASVGEDVIDGGAGNDTLRLFGSADGFAFERSADGTVVAISLDGAEGRSTLSSVEQVYSVADDRLYAIDELAGEIGTPLNDAMVSGTARDDRLFGLAGDDTLVGMAGDDTIDGGDGEDIADYLGAISDYLIYYDRDGSLVVEALAGSEGRDRLVDIEGIHFRTGDALLGVLAVPALGTSGADAVTGDVRANFLYGLDGDDVMAGAGGGDMLHGGAGDDVYVFAPGDGDDLVVELDGEGYADRLDLTAFDPADVALSQDAAGAPGDLLVRILATGETIRVAGQYTGWDGRGIEAIDFAGAVSWDWAAIRAAAAIVGTPGDDVLHGAEVGATILAGTGDDTIHSGNGGDSLVYLSGGGDDVFIDGGGAWDGDSLLLPDIASGGVQLVRDRFDLLVHFLATGETLRVPNQFGIDDWDSALLGYSLEQGFETISFADDSMLDREGIGAVAEAVSRVGTAENDRLLGTALDDVIDGGEGDDLIAGIGGDDALSGGGGGDYILGSWDTAQITGGTGDDRLESGGGDTVYAYAPGDGHDEIVGGLGMDALELDPAIVPSDVTVTLVDQGRSFLLSLAGGSVRLIDAATFGGAFESVTFADATVWTPADLLQRAVPAHVEDGTAGADLIEGIANRSHWLSGLGGDDHLVGWLAADALDGGDGDDLLDGSFGSDSMTGGPGDDIYIVDDPADVVVEAMGEGVDTIRTDLHLYFMPDEVEELEFTGTSGVDVYGNDLGNRIVGGAGSDFLLGRDGNDILLGHGGADYLSGGHDQDVLLGHEGDDALFGEGDSDLLDGGPGRDLMAGGWGHDTYFVDDPLDVVEEGYDGGLDHVLATSTSYALPENVENLSYAGSGDFHGVGNAAPNEIAGGAGDDFIFGGGGPDLLTGGSGADIFGFGEGDLGLDWDVARIADFLSGTDRIDLSAIDADSGSAGDQAFAFIGAAAFTGAAGQLRWFQDGGDIWLEADTDGDGAADFHLVLLAAATPAASDFLL